MTPVLSRVSRKWAIGSAPLDIVKALGSETATSPLLKSLSSCMFSSRVLISSETPFHYRLRYEFTYRSILSLGTFFGALAAAPIADGIGRRLGIMISCIVFSIGVAMQAAATNTPLFVFGRVGAGLGVGLVSCMIPMYQVRLYLQIQ